MGHIVVDGMPGGAETALLAIRIVGDDVDAGDVGNGIHGDMVVGDGITLCHREAAAITYDSGGLPYLVDDMTGVLFRHDFLIELRALSSYHIEKDAIAGFVA